MQNLTKLFRLIEITRSQPQYGYALAEIPKQDLSDLAQHQYLVTFIAWQLCRLVNKAGAKINMEKVLEFALIHDLGELFGGDIAMPYGKANPRARKLAKAFEAENQKYLARFFGDDQKYFKALGAEILNAKSDESLIAKIADYIECTHYKLYLHRFSKGDVVMAQKKIDVMIKKLRDPIARQELAKFINSWAKELNAKDVAEILDSAKHA